MNSNKSTLIQLLHQWINQRSIKTECHELRVNSREILVRVTMTVKSSVLANELALIKQRLWNILFCVNQSSTHSVHIHRDSDMEPGAMWTLNTEPMYKADVRRNNASGNPVTHLASLHYSVFAWLIDSLTDWLTDSIFICITTDCSIKKVTGRP